MEIIVPIELTDAMLISSTVPENEYPNWDVSSTFNKGERCIRPGLHLVFESLIDNNVGLVPENNTGGATPAWVEVGATNQRAMFDKKVGTKTTATDSMTIVLMPGQIGGMTFMELVGRQLDFVMKDGPGGTVVKSESIVLDGTIVTSVYNWFIQPFRQRSTVVFTDLPNHYFNPEITITISSAPGATVACGICKLGMVTDIGPLQWNPSIGMRDFSKNKEDTFGNMSLQQGGWKATNDYIVEIEPTDLEFVYAQLVTVRSKYCVIIGTSLNGFAPLIVYGFVESFNIDLPYPSIYYGRFKIQGALNG